MIGLDTNVLLRLGDDDEPAPARPRAALGRRLDGANGCFVNAIVLAEFAWTLHALLQVAAARRRPHRIAVILESPEFVVASADEASRGRRQIPRRARRLSPTTFSPRSTLAPAAPTTATFDQRRAQIRRAFPVRSDARLIA